LINFISNLPKDLRSGGFSAMNVAAYSAISSLEPTCYVGPINPPAILSEKVVSKFRRMAGSQGRFFFFSQRRLKAIADEVHTRCPANARLDFFHGFTPWILTRPPRPYMAWSDCTFHDYIEIFHRREQFRSDDLECIEHAEAAWLKQARFVIFSSQWGADRAISHYHLDASRVASVGIFGEIEMPARDAYDGGKEFAFVSTNFQAKGGPTVLSAFREVRKAHSGASLTIVGDAPPNLAAEPGVSFAGFLRKEIPGEYQRLLEILGRARALVHPTKSDIAPLLLVEAGYLGCPVISSRKFGIPELVDDGRTGLLLHDPSQPAMVAAAMRWMLEHPDEYRKMREAAWRNARELHSRQKFEERMLACVREDFAVERVAEQQRVAAP
jgi:glycosyltransferase involved in cell wall biosynthesis